MTTEEKQLLLVDLCARLPYGVICDMWFERNPEGKITEFLKCGGLMRLMNEGFDFVAIPYLRPMSSMTEEETNKLIFLCNLEADTENNGFFNRFGITIATKEHHCFPKIVSEVKMDIMDFLNSHHFDYRGLIEKGLALEAPEGMYNPK